MDSLRYWVLEMHVDGFRFDLASTLAREFYEVDRLATFFDLVQQDPVVSQVKLIAEPWDVGPGGYQVGNFPPQWTEWNGKYRDTVRDFWRGEAQSLGEFASRLTGSSDLYEHSGRRPVASINFVTAHDGFTLRDLVSYKKKHNEANGEDNRDGADDNRSMNFGVEGPTDDPTILTLRARQQRNFIATLLLSQGVPMLLARRRTRPHPARQQQRLRAGQRADLGATGMTSTSRSSSSPPRWHALRKAHPTFRRSRFFDGRPVRREEGAPIPDIVWGRPDGVADAAGGLGLRLRARDRRLPQRRGHPRPRSRAGEPIVDRHFFVLFNAGDEIIDFHIPAVEFSPKWDVVVDTAGERADTRSDRTRARRSGSRRSRCSSCRTTAHPDRAAITRSRHPSPVSSAPRSLRPPRRPSSGTEPEARHAAAPHRHNSLPGRSHPLPSGARPWRHALDTKDRHAPRQDHRHPRPRDRLL